MSTSFRRLDHINVRVSSLAAARPFFAELLPALGFSKDVSNDVWLQFEAASSSSAAEFFGVTESPSHVPNEAQLAFWADSNEEVDGWRSWRAAPGLATCLPHSARQESNTLR